jgi:hypothetical protein
MEIDAAIHGVDFLLAEQFDLLGLAGGFTGVLRDEGTDAFAEALDVLAIFQQGGDGAVPAPAVRSLRAAVFHDDAVLRLDVVGADAFVRQRALAHEVGEGIDVAAGLPDGGIHEDAGIQAEHVLAFAGHGVPPGGAQVALQLRAERAVVPHAAAAAVDFAALIDEAAALAEGDDFLHLRLGCFGVGGHGGWNDELRMRSRAERDRQPSGCPAGVNKVNQCRMTGVPPARRGRERSTALAWGQVRFTNMEELRMKEWRMADGPSGAASAPFCHFQFRHSQFLHASTPPTKASHPAAIPAPARETPPPPGHRLPWPRPSPAGSSAGA